MNEIMNKFMKKFEFEGLTYDDVSLVTAHASFLPEDTDISSRLTRNITLSMPIVSAAMDTVTEKDMAIGMAMLGGLGIIHKNLPPEEQARQVGVVKHHLNGVIWDPIVFNAKETIGDVMERKKRKGYSFNGFPIVDDKKRVVGILTSADIKFAPSMKTKVSKLMSSNVVSAPEGTTLAKAYKIMIRERVGKLPLVKKGKLVGLYSFSDVKSLVENQNQVTNRDDKYRLRVGAAVGPHAEGRVDKLATEEVDVIVVDTAHGDTTGVIDMVKWTKEHYPEIDVIAGNVATGDSAKNLRKAGADAVKVGIGPGSICTTRVVAGVGIPQVSAIYECAKALRGSIPVIADGGIKHSGDVPKAIAAGAEAVMMGSLLAGTEESPGEKIIHQGRQYVVYRGMGSLGAMKQVQGSRDRYQQENVADEDLVPQGIEGIVPYAGRVRKVLVQFCGGLRASLGYCGCRSIKQLRSKGRFVRVSIAGLKEAHPHDVKIMKESPNYQQ